jgi:homoprotocatechuate degradation regulator HpaR
MSRPHATHRSLAIALLRTREAVMSHFRPHLAELGLTEQQWRVLRVLNEENEIDAGALAQKACIHPASLSRILKTLQRQKFIAVTTRADDARRSHVRLAAKGVDVLRGALPQTAAVYRKIEKQIGSDELQKLQDLLEHVQTQLHSP